jgi:3-isopropylmalate/(R)-2-methylmalate dehydratase small subunit
MSVEPLIVIDAVAVPFAGRNVDTDQIVPARFLKKRRKDGFGQYLFHDLRFGADGLERPDFVLNQPAFRSAGIIVAERNFGCGSSREAAVWALYDYGVRVAIAESFGDIFFNNSLKNGLLPLVLPAPIVIGLMASLQATPGRRLRVDLPTQTVTLPDDTVIAFEVDPFAKECLIGGLDELAYTLSKLDAIAAFEHARNTSADRDACRAPRSADPSHAANRHSPR